MFGFHDSYDEEKENVMLIGYFDDNGEYHIVEVIICEAQEDIY